MGISRRNPRGNFNWQSRMLLRRSICCGNLNEPVDCDLLAPTLSFGGTIVCKAKLSSPNANVTVTNTQPNQAATTFFEWYKGGPGGALVYSSFGPVSTLVLTPAQQTVGILKFWVVATNELGCVTEQLVNVYVFNKPELGTVITAATDPCLPSAHPSGFSSNGQILALNNNTTPNALYYVYRIQYLSSSPNPGYSANTPNTIAGSYAWTDLCEGNYLLSLELWGNINGVPTLVCMANNLVVNMGPLILGFDDILNAPVANPASVSDWNSSAFFGSSISAVSVVGNEVYLYPTSVSGFNSLYSPTFWQNLISIDDRGGWVNVVTAGGLYSSPLLASVVLNSTTQIFQDGFQFSGPFDAYFPSCTIIGPNSFSNSDILSADFPLLTSIPSGAFEFASSMSSGSFPNVTTVGSNGFRATGLLIADFPNVTSVDFQGFNQCLLLTDIIMPNILSAANSAFSVTQNLVFIDMPLLEDVGFDCFAGDITQPSLYNNVLTSVNFPSLLQAAAGAFKLVPQLQNVNMPVVTVLGNDCFVDTNIQTLNIPSCTVLGNTVGNNNVFALVTGNNITATVNSVLQTNNAGGLDGDLAYLNANNTVTFTWV